jgi:hypothetical protein
MEEVGSAKPSPAEGIVLCAPLKLRASLRRKEGFLFALYGTAKAVP